jgi:hypothetical protein
MTFFVSQYKQSMKNQIKILTLAVACLFAVACNSEDDPIGAEVPATTDLDTAAAQPTEVAPVPDVDTPATPKPANVPACEFVGSWMFVEIGGAPADGPQQQLVLTFNADGTASTTGLGKVRTAIWKSEDCSEVFMDADDGPDQTMSDIKYEGDRMSFIANELELIVVQRIIETPAE